MIRITELGLALGDSRDVAPPSDVALASSVPKGLPHTRARPALYRSVEASHARLLTEYPELRGPSGRRLDPGSRSGVEWLLDTMREQSKAGTEPRSALRLICLAHSTIDINVLHAPAARIKHELSARKALPFALGQAQTLAFFFALKLAGAWSQTLGEGAPQAEALLAAVEKRRAPLISHFSRGAPISDAVAFAEVLTGRGPGLALLHAQVDTPLLALQHEGFDQVLDAGDAAFARMLAGALTRGVSATLGPDATLIAAGPNLKGRLAAQVAGELRRLSDGRIQSLDPLDDFFMATDPIASLRHADLRNSRGLPLLLWSVDQRLALGSAIFSGRLN